MQVHIVRDVSPVVEQLLQPLSRSDAEVMTALGASLQILVDGLAPDDLPARITFLPQTFCANVLFAFACWSSFDRRFLSCEPGHLNSATTVTRERGI